MQYNEIKVEIANLCKKYNVAEWEIYNTKNTSLNIKVVFSEIASFSSKTSTRLRFRAKLNGNIGNSSTQSYDKESLEKLVTQAIDNASFVEDTEEGIINSNIETYKETVKNSIKPYTTEELKKIALDTQASLYKADNRVSDGSATYIYQITNEVSIYNSYGLDVSNYDHDAAIMCMVNVKEGDETRTCYDGAEGDIEKFDVNKLVQKALKYLGSTFTTTRKTPVLFDKGCMVDILDTFFSVFNGEAALQGLSRLKDKEGEIIASQLISITDDPFYPGLAFQSSFDSEGSATHKKSVIKDGKLETLLWDLKNAKKAGKKTTGNASLGGVSHFNFYIENGKESFLDVVSKMGNGVYVTQMKGFHAGANPVSGDFSIESNGFIVENGEISKPIESFTVAGNFYDLLKDTIAVADDLELDFSLSGSRVGSPSILVKELSIAGK